MSRNDGKSENVESASTTTQSSSTSTIFPPVRDPYEFESRRSEYAQQFGNHTDDEAEQREERLFNLIQSMKEEMVRLKVENHEFRATIESSLKSIQVKMESEQEEEKYQSPSAKSTNSGNALAGLTKPKVEAGQPDQGATGHNTIPMMDPSKQVGKTNFVNQPVVSPVSSTVANSAISTVPSTNNQRNSRGQDFYFPPLKSKTSKSLGLFGEATFASTLPDMAKLDSKRPNDFHSWKQKALTYFSANGLMEIVKKDPKNSFQQALTIDDGQQDPVSIRAKFVSLHIKVWGKIYDATIRVLHQSFFDRIGIVDTVNYSYCPIASSGWMKNFKYGNAHLLWADA